MGELLCVDFKTRSRTYTRVAEQKPPHEITLAEIEAEIGAALWGGQAYPALDEIHYHAPDKDPA